jgi:hypothetical protein
MPPRNYLNRGKRADRPPKPSDPLTWTEVDLQQRILDWRDAWQPTLRQTLYSDLIHRVDAIPMLDYPLPHCLGNLQQKINQAVNEWRDRFYDVCFALKDSKYDFSISVTFVTPPDQPHVGRLDVEWSPDFVAFIQHDALHFESTGRSIPFVDHPTNPQRRYNEAVKKYGKRP